MKRKLTILLLCLLTLLACSCSKHTAKAEATEDTENSTTESEVPTPTATPKPIPTPRSRYIPGDDLYGMLSVTGDVVIEPQYNYLGGLFTEENLARFQDYETGLWGYINESGEEVIPAQYEDAQDFSDGLAAVKVDKLYGFIDVTGEIVIDPQFEGVASEFAYGRCVMQADGMQGVIDQTGKVILEANYLSVTLCCETYFVVQCEDKMYQVLDQSGNVVAEDKAEIYMVTDSGYYFVKTDDITDNMYDFAGNLFYVFGVYHKSFITINGDDFVFSSNDGNAWGLFNLDTGEYLIEPTNQDVQLADDEQNRNKIVYILSSEICGFASAVTGEVILPNNVYWLIGDKGDYVFYATSEEEYFCVGVMNLAGEIITPDQYSQTFAVSSDGQIALERQDGRSTVINGNGEEVLLTEEDICICGYVPLLDCWLYRTARTYSIDEETGYWDCDSVADENMGILTRDGEVAIANDYPFIILDNGSVFCCDSDTSAEFVDTDLTLVKVDSIATLIDCTTQSNTLVTIDGEGRYGLIDSQGNVLYAASDIRIYTNSEYRQYDVASETTSEGEASHPSEYVNSEYNDSDYYLISKEAE